MNELPTPKTEEKALSFIPANAQEAELGDELKGYSNAAWVNTLQMGRVLIESKKTVERGHWKEWVEYYGGFSSRYAEMLMQAYTRYGNHPALNGASKTNIFKMLSLPEGKEEEFMQKNDVSSMTAKEVEKAVRKVRQEMAEQLEAEKKARQDAEQRAKLAESRPSEMPDDVAERLRMQEAQITQLKEIARDSLDEKNRLQRENTQMQRDLKEQAELLEETQEQCDRAKADLLNAQSAIARGDAERIPSDTLTPDALAAAVNSFIGAVCRMPHMQGSFATMDGDTRREYDELLTAVEEWTKGARKALNTAGGEGRVY